MNRRRRILTVLILTCLCFGCSSWSSLEPQQVDYLLGKEKSALQKRIVSHSNTSREVQASSKAGTLYGAHKYRIVEADRSMSMEVVDAAGQITAEVVLAAESGSRFQIYTKDHRHNEIYLDFAGPQGDKSNQVLSSQEGLRSPDATVAEANVYLEDVLLQQEEEECTPDDPDCEEECTPDDPDCDPPPRDCSDNPGVTDGTPGDGMATSFLELGWIIGEWLSSLI